jgi:site-specific recombinase
MVALATSASRPPATDIKALVKEAAPEAPDAVGADLDRLLTSMEPAGSLTSRLDTLERLCLWLAEDRPIELPARAAVSGKTRAARLWLLVEVLKRSSPSRSALSRLLTGVLAESSALKLFSRAGLHGELRIFSEAADRLARKLLPQPPDDSDLAALAVRLFPDTKSSAWLEEAPPGLVIELLSLLLDGENAADAVGHVLDDAADAVALLSVRVASIGVDEDIRERGGLPSLRSNPFLEMPRVCDAILDARFRKDDETSAQLRARCGDLIDLCKASLARVMERLEEGSVSVDLVFRLELLGQLLDRVRALQRLLDDSELERGPEAVRFFKELVRAGISDRSLRALVKGNSRLLARKIIERAGETGEHYITSTRAEYHQMITSAAGGGFLTAFTTAMKFLIGWAKLPFFFEWFLSGLNYAGSFVLLQGLGFTLATKQPSMTAATLAAALDNGGGLDKLVDQIARTSRSQLAAIVGNIGMVLPAAVALHFAVYAIMGKPFLDRATADYVIQSLNPIGSGTLVFAAFTGCLLWASSIIAGWLENWSVYRRLPEAIAQHRGLIKRLGAERCQHLSRVFARNISGFGGNVSLGFLLAGTPVFGKLFGLPLDVRHVTLSTGALALAGCAVGPEAILTPAFAWAALGIVCIGTLNFGVSFTLALAVALRARNVALADVVELGRALVVRFFQRPRSFFYPPRDEDRAPAGATPPLARSQ